MYDFGQMGRRRLITGVAAAAATGAVGAVTTGVIVHKRDETDAKAQLKEALAQIQQKKGISLDAATKTAKTTQQATTVVAQPVGQMLVKIASLVGGALSDALSSLISFLNTAKTVLSAINGLSEALGQLADLLTTWQTDIDAITALFDLLVGGGDFLEAVDFCEALAEVLIL